MIYLAAFTVFWASFLFFVIELLSGKLLLPLFGGSSLTWSVSLFYFQIILLVSYSTFSFFVSKKTFSYFYILVFSLLVMAIIGLPIEFSIDALSTQYEQNPLPLLIFNLLSETSILLFALGTFSPLVQSLYTAHTKKSPYFLYAIGNFGSLLGLISFPILIESNFSNDEQQFIILVVSSMILMGMLIIGLLAFYKKIRLQNSLNLEQLNYSKQVYKFNWVVYATVPSAILIGSTSYITQNIAPVPLLWTMPLIVYIGSYVVAFSSFRFNYERISKYALFSALSVLFAFMVEAQEPLAVMIALHLFMFFLVSLSLHRKLYDLKPEPEFLGGYYLCIGLGGAIGGLASSLICPIVFNFNWEYPLSLILSIFLLTGNSSAIRQARLSLPRVLLLLGLLVLQFYLVKLYGKQDIRLYAVLLSIFIALYYSVARSQTYFTLILLILVIYSRAYQDDLHGIVWRQRNFYGTLSVRASDKPARRELMHGSTIHGIELAQQRDKCVPGAYYHPESALSVSTSAIQRSAQVADVAVVGLGTGAMACYARPVEHWTFFEIDPKVVELANNHDEFTFIQNTKAKSVNFIVEDGRIGLKKFPEKSLDLIILDAFSSDSIPVHLITLEAINIYLDTLRPEGFLIIHISNRYLDLSKVLEPIFRTLELEAYFKIERKIPESLRREFMFPSHVLVVRRKSNSTSEVLDQSWERLSRSENAAWTDQYSNILSAFK